MNIMNIWENDILYLLFQGKFENQRKLSEQSGYSLGTVNQSIRYLFENGYIDSNNNVTSKTIDYIENKKVKRAVILAAGYGMRMVPINTEVPKGLIEVNGETLIERIIKHLHEVNINEIYVVVGFLKEKYEYLIDEYDIKLIVNTEYSQKNNLYSLYLAKNYLKNSYIIPCDIWCSENIFHEYEMYSWYMVNDKMCIESNIRVNRKKELISVADHIQGNTMVGVCYLDSDDIIEIEEKLDSYANDIAYRNSFWEEILYNGNKMLVNARVVNLSDVVEINTYEQLRELDTNSNQLKNEAINLICDALQVKSNEIKNIEVLKKGMTNRSFLFNCKGKKYIMRIPGEGTDQLINRQHEAEVYQTIKDKRICDDIVYINPENGYKITEFLDGSRVCDPLNYDDVKKCMKRLKEFHALKLKVNHIFDIFGQIEFYEKLWNGTYSIYKDYKTTKANVMSLRSYIDAHAEEKVLTHIDAVPDNFLFVDKDGKEEIRLIDWEYAGMQDPHVDIAMFCIYSLYNKGQVDQLIGMYFTEGCDDETRIKIYCYIAVCGLLWSNWCEYKRNLGVEFGEYSIRQYRYAKDYYRIVQDELRKRQEEE